MFFISQDIVQPIGSGGMRLIGDSGAQIDQTGNTTKVILDAREGNAVTFDSVTVLREST